MYISTRETSIRPIHEQQQAGTKAKEEKDWIKLPDSRARRKGVCNMDLLMARARGNSRGTTGEGAKTDDEGGRDWQRAKCWV